MLSSIVVFGFVRKDGMAWNGMDEIVDRCDGFGCGTGELWRRWERRGEERR